MTETLIDTDAVAAYIGVAATTLRKWRMTGAGPRFVRLGRAVRYRASDLDSFVQRRVYSNTAEADAG